VLVGLLQPGVDQLPRLVVADRILDHLPQAEHLNPRVLRPDELKVVLRLTVSHQTYPIFSPRRLIVSAISSRAFNVPAQRLSCFSEMRKSPSDIPPCNAFCSVLSIRSGSAVSNVPAYISMYGRAHWRVDTPFGLCGYIAEAATSSSI